LSDPSVPQTETLPERCPSRTQCQHRRGHVGLHDYDDAAGTLGLDLDALAGALEALSDDDLEYDLVNPKEWSDRYYEAAQTLSTEYARRLS
jgi:hypothetical protein